MNTKTKITWTRDKEQIRKEVQSLVLLRLQTKDKEELEKLKEQIL